MSQVIISAIAALSENRVIGLNNELPWHIPADLKYFKDMTTGKPIIMGRKTFESLGKPLPGRANFIITRQKLSIPGASVCASVKDAIAAAGKTGAKEIMIIGGQQIYEQALPLCHKLYLTRIHARMEGDAYFPQINQTDWREISTQHHAGNPAFTFSVLMRI